MKAKSVICLGLVCALLLGTAAISASAEAAQRCTIQADRTDGLYNSLTISGQLADNYAELNERFFRKFQEMEYELSYQFVENVTVEVQGKRMQLEEAISQGKLTVEEILADARRDSCCGICQETTQTKNGLTQFAYCYPEMNLVFCNDVLEAPNGTEHLIRFFQVTAPGEPVQMSTALFDMTTPYHYFLDREDWGLDFRVLSTDAAGLTMEIAQSGGQQFGQLAITDFRIYSAGDWKVIGSVPLNPQLELCMNGTDEVKLRWDEICGQLERGKYCLSLLVVDQFAPEDIPPLSRDFHDQQTYYVEFQIQ